MGRSGITQTDVYKAAQAIAEDGAFPTIQSVRAKIGSGSLVTIHKHLLSWKQERLLQSAVKIADSKDALKAREVFKQKLELEKIIEKQIAQNVEISAQLLNLEQENLELKTKVVVLEDKQNALVSESLDLGRKVVEHNDLVCELKSAHLEALELMLKDKNLEIESLKVELKSVHLASVEVVRQTSFDGQDLLMSERVKNLNLIEQIKLLNAKISQLERNSLNFNKVTRDIALDKTQSKIIKSYTLDEISASTAPTAKVSDEGIT